MLKRLPLIPLLFLTLIYSARAAGAVANRPNPNCHTIETTSYAIELHCEALIRAIPNPQSIVRHEDFHLRNVSPDGRLLAYQVRGVRGGTHVEVMDIWRGVSLRVPTCRLVWCLNPSWRPDSSAIAYIRARAIEPQTWQIGIWDLNTSSEVNIGSIRDHRLDRNGRYVWSMGVR